MIMDGYCGRISPRDLLTWWQILRKVTLPLRTLYVATMYVCGCDVMCDVSSS
jgi:hypothetical protein